jgi:imidazolonepropionase-like amidohydrolase
MVTVLRADLLIDGSGRPPVQDPSVVVADGVITGVFSGDPPPGAVPPAARGVDCRGATLLPGLIDCHVHLNFPGNGSALEEFIREPDEVLTASAAFAALTALHAGITTVRDTGSKGGTVTALRRALDLGLGHGPRLLLCGAPITMTGGHTWPLGGEADGEDGVRRKVRELAKAGADWIKVMGTGGGTANTMSWLPSFRPAELAAIVDEAHRLARKVTVHCLSGAAIADAVDAGADQIEHASFFVDGDGRQEYDPAVVEKMAESQIAVTATLAVRAYAVRGNAARAAESEQYAAARDRWKMMSEAQIRQFGQMHDAGVRFVAGSDAGWLHTPFDAVIEEVALMHQGGMPAAAAIAAATGTAAAVLGIGDQVGLVAAGYSADLIAVAGNPLRDLRALRDVTMVMRGGQPQPLPGRTAPGGTADD